VFCDSDHGRRRQSRSSLYLPHATRSDLLSNPTPSRMWLAPAIREKETIACVER